LRDAVPEEREDFFTDDLIDVFEKMLVVDPEERITVSELLTHKFFK
jgi:serine/threonine protein kinase